jgi:hypothetical protein
MEGDSINLSMRKALALRQAWLRGSRQAHRAVALAFCQAQQVRTNVFSLKALVGVKQN